MPLSGPDDERQTYIGGVAVRRRGDDAGLEQGAHDGGIKLWNAGTLFHLAGSKGAVLPDHEPGNGIVFPLWNTFRHGEMGVGVFLDDIGVALAGQRLFNCSGREAGTDTGKLIATSAGAPFGGGGKFPALATAAQMASSTRASPELTLISQEKGRPSPVRRTMTILSPLAPVGRVQC